MMTERVGPAVDDPRCLHEIYAEVAARFPERVAVADPDRRLTFAELDRAANRLAHRLQREGAGPETLVALCAERTVDLAIGLIGILKSGAGYLPLDPRHPAERLRDTVADAGCIIVVGDSPLDLGLQVVAPNDPALPEETDTAPRTGAVPDNVAYVIYTSGSTGRPKGVVVPHTQVTRLFAVLEKEFDFSDNDVWTIFHSIAFDFSVWELFGALLHGGRAVIVPYEVSRDPGAFLRLVIEEGVTRLSQTPSAFRQLARAAEILGFPSTALRTVVFGGEKLDFSGLRRWADHYGQDGPALVNMYGITELTVHVTYHRITADDLHRNESVIGRPLDDLQVHVLDDQLSPLPVGQTGEMYIGGRGVARGYLSRPELSLERFLPDPFSGPGGRLYRTGDLARVNTDGQLVFEGRADDQIQLRGFRIELGEVEAVIREHATVADAAAALRSGTDGTQRLVGYWIPSSQTENLDTAAEVIRRFLARRLPPYMVPSHLVPLSELPLSVNGKLNRAALPAPAAPSRGLGAAVPPRDAFEARLAAVWAEVLGLESVGVHDDFFALGGDSMMAIPLVAQAKEADLPVDLVALFTHPTVAGMVQASRSKGMQASPGGRASDHDRTGTDEFVPLQVGIPAGAEEVYPAGLVQQGIVFHSLFSGDPTLYHDAQAVWLHDDVDLHALRRALRSLVRRHHVLRTAFDLGTEGNVRQVVHRDVDIEPVVVPARPPTQDRRTALVQWWEGQWQEAFDLTRAPLIRCHLLACRTGGNWLVVSAHHAILDGWSFALLMAELLEGYDRELAGRTAHTEAPQPLAYKRFIALEHQESASEEARSHWLALLEGSNATTLLGPPAPEPECAPACHPDVKRAVPAELSSRVASLARRLGVPTRSVYLAAHLTALGELTGTSDVVTGVVVNSRPEESSAERALGLFLNTVPVRVDLNGVSASALASRTFALEQESFVYRRFAMPRLRQELGRMPFHVLFNYTNFARVADLSGLPNVRVGEWWTCDRNSFVVSVEIGRERTTEQWWVSVRVDRATVSVDAAEALARHLEDALWRLTAEGPSKVRRR